MRARAPSLTGPLSLRTRETVATETPASRATSLMVTFRGNTLGSNGVGPRRRGRGGRRDCKRLQSAVTPVKELASHSITPCQLRAPARRHPRRRLLQRLLCGRLRRVKLLPEPPHVRLQQPL